MAQFTVAVAVPPGVIYSSGATFTGDVTVLSTNPAIYTLAEGLQSLTSSTTIDLTTTVTDQQALSSSTLSGSVIMIYNKFSRSTILAVLTKGTASAQSAPLPSSSSNTAPISDSSVNTSSFSTPTSMSAIASPSSTLPSTSSTVLSSSSTTSSSSSAISSSSLAASTNSSTGQGHSTTELIGVAIGVLIAGALVAALVVFLIMRKTNKKHIQKYKSVKGRQSLTPIGEAMVVDEKDWQRHLPQSESDNTTSRSTAELFDQIELHVENFYADRMVEMRNTTVGRPSQLLSEAISSGLRPTSAIKYAITTIVLSSIDFQGESEYSLLPANFSTVKLQADYRKPGFGEATSQWRILTAYLGANTLQTETYLSERERKTTAIANQLCRAFSPWLQSDSKICHQGTNGILKRGSDLGVMFFSQPASFIWDWGKDQPRRGEKKTILPGLIKITDESAQSIPKHVCLVKRRTEL